MEILPSNTLLLIGLGAIALIVLFYIASKLLGGKPLADNKNARFSNFQAEQEHQNQLNWETQEEQRRIEYQMEQDRQREIEYQQEQERINNDYYNH